MYYVYTNYDVGVEIAIAETAPSFPASGSVLAPVT